MTICPETKTIKAIYEEWIELMYFIKQVIQHSGYTKHEFYDKDDQLITLRVEETK